MIRDRRLRSHEDGRAIVHRRFGINLELRFLQMADGTATEESKIMIAEEIRYDESRYEESR